MGNAKNKVGNARITLEQGVHQRKSGENQGEYYMCSGGACHSLLKRPDDASGFADEAASAFNVGNAAILYNGYLLPDIVGTVSLT